MRTNTALHISLACCVLAAGCTTSDAPTGPAASDRHFTLQSEQSQVSANPPSNLDVSLSGQGSGLVRFRQPIDDLLIIHLNTSVTGLAPNTSYLLQRAVDTEVNNNCTGSAWLTLGKGLTPQAITTDSHGTGHQELYRNVSASPVGAKFDIHFRVIDAVTSAVVLTSGCYQYMVTK